MLAPSARAMATMLQSNWLMGRPGAAPGGADGIGAGGFTGEGQDATAETLIQRAIDGGVERGATATGRKDRHTMRHFGCADRREADARPILRGPARLALLRRSGPQQFGKHPRVEKNHAPFPPNRGGSRTVSRAGKSSSMPPNGAIRAGSSRQISRRRRLDHHMAEDFAALLLHRTFVLGCPNT